MNKKYYFFVILILVVIPFLLSDFNNIFNNDTVSILNFGDVMFDRGVRNIIENRGRDPFEYIKKDLSVIKEFDVVIANLEGPIVEMDRNLCQQKEFNFQFASNTPERLKGAGITMVNIANNHSYDCYKAGFESTKRYLEKAGIDYIGDNILEKSFIIKTINNKKIAFVGMDETVQLIPISKFYPLLKKLKTENDYIVVNIHWGKEYERKATSTQIAIAHALIDNGADAIFGHHPHVIEPVEIYKGKTIFYSLGNFVFDQNFGDTTTGLGVGLELGKIHSTFTLFPYKMKLFAPDFLKGDERNKFCQNYLKNITHSKCGFEML